MAGYSANSNIEMMPNHKICDDTLQSAEDDVINISMDLGL